MLQRLYIHNFRCLENFDLSVKEMPSSLFVGKNGSGKSTIGIALEVLQQIGRGVNRVGQLVQPKDFTRGRSDVPIRFEVDVLLEDKQYHYELALELPDSFKELRIFGEQLNVAGTPVYSRKGAQVTLSKNSSNLEAKFLIDWHLVALPLIQEQSSSDPSPLQSFKTWLAHMLILAPIPSLISGDSNGETLEPERDCSNFGEWFSGVLGRNFAAYSQIDSYLREVMPDIKDIQTPLIGKDSKSMIVCFEEKQAKLNVPFKDLSDGEKCFFICAVVLAANKSYGPLFCFWDEPDNYLSLSEAGHFITALRRMFNANGQIFMTSHNPEAIRKFSNENTLVLLRKSHLEPTVVRTLDDIHAEGGFHGDLVEALIRCDVL